MQRSGELKEDGSPAGNKDKRANAQNRVREDRTSPKEFLNEVRGELRKVAWPSREETVKYSVIVFFAILIMSLFIFGVDLGFGKFTAWLFPSPTDSAAAVVGSIWT